MVIQTDMTRKIERAVVAILGADRVRAVSSEVMENSDGAKIARVNVLYAAAQGLTVDEMEGVLDAIWPGDDLAAPFPVIDFQEDTDVEPVAAE